MSTSNLQSPCLIKSTKSRVIGNSKALKAEVVRASQWPAHLAADLKQRLAGSQDERWSACKVLRAWVSVLAPYVVVAALVTQLEESRGCHDPWVQLLLFESLCCMSICSPRKPPRESLQQASSGRSQQRQHRISCHGNSTTALPAVTLYLERHSKDLCLPEQGHHPFFPLSSKWQKNRSEPYSRRSSSSRSSKSSGGRDGSTSTRATSLIDFAFLADKASAGAVATTPATSKKRRTVHCSNNSYSNNSSAPVATFPNNSIIWNNSSNNSRSSNKNNKSTAQPTNVAAVGGAGAAEAEVAAESPLLRKGNPQAEREDITQPARLSRAISAPTELEGFGTRAALGSAAAPAIAEEGFVSRKRQGHHHQEEQLRSPDASAAAAAATTSYSSPQRSSSLPLLSAVSLPLLQQPRQQQRRNLCFVASERNALRVASARPATALPPAAVAEAAFHDNAVSPQSSFSYDPVLSPARLLCLLPLTRVKRYIMLPR
ncbi:hypothetical protein Emed_001465 [Eimeria media]